MVRDFQQALRRAAPRERLRPAARLGLLLAAGLLLTVYGLAAWIDPFDAAGRPLRQGTHEQLGLGPCAFQEWTGKPCATCGMTTAFSLLAHGRPIASLKANAAGCLLALAGAPLAGLCLWAGLRGRWWGPALPETWLLPLAVGCLGFVLLVWFAKLAWPVG